MKYQIFKIQIPLAGNRVPPVALAYNQNRTMERYLPITDDLTKMMAGSPKKFFYAHVDLDTRLFEIKGEAPWQEW